MNSFLNMIKADYLQRTRSYAFLITLCASLAIAYTFVPEPNAGYSTIRFGDYVGNYNSAWFGYVTAIMSSVFLSLIGFYLVNSSIKTDINTKVGQIVAATPISNFKYLLSKVLSNFLVLLTIVLVIFTMSIILFFLYNDGYPFELFQFIKPYLLITLPTLFVVSVLAVVFEVFFGKYSILQSIGFFFLFSVLMAITPQTATQFSLDIFGGKMAMHQLEQAVREVNTTDKEISVNVGYSLGTANQEKKFDFNGVNFPTLFIISRLLFIGFGIALIAMISPFFHRFNTKERSHRKRFKSVLKTRPSSQEVILGNLPKPQVNHSLIPLIKAEMLLLFRKGKKWLWFLNISGMVLLAVLPINIAHQMVLPILWFLQVGRLSDLTSKEITHNTHYFVFTSYKPISKLLLSQYISATTLMVLLAVPLIIRLGLSFDFTTALAVLLGAFFIVVLAALLGILSNGKKLFEVLFFMITYANINGIPAMDYFGAFNHNKFYLVLLPILIVVMLTISILKRKHQLAK